MSGEASSPRVLRDPARVDAGCERGGRRRHARARRARSTLATTLCAAVLSASCLPGPTYRVPRAPTPFARAYKEAAGNAGAWKVATPRDAIPRGAWWVMFRDSELDALETRLNISNQNIAQAFANYVAARALVRAARAGYFPTVAASPGVVWSRSPNVGITSVAAPALGVPAGPAITGERVVYNVRADASWAPDVFGRVRYAVRYRQYGAQVSAADLESTRLLMQASLAQIYFQIRGQDALQELLDATVASNAEIVVLTRQRFERGLDPEIALVQSELTLEVSRVNATSAAILRAQLEHAIATLLGVPATDFTVAKRASLPTPPRIPTGTPSHLLERRPDIAAAERLMASANATIGLGYAAYYPVVTIAGTFGFLALSLGSLFTWSSRAWSLGGNVAETVFDGGLRRANIDQAIALYNANVAAYRQTVLAAFQQVEDLLVQTRVLAQEIEQQRTTVKLAERAFQLEKVRFEEGLDPYIYLMLQQTALFSEQQVLVTLQIQHMASAVQLVQALGGGWDRSLLPTPSQVSKPLPAWARTIWR
jgi:NodT family efflux transporter outer membrane factor (OMF) lipoprotein